MVQRYLISAASAAAVASVIGSATIALAADLPPPPPPPVEIRESVYDWSGLYVGVNAGAGFADSHFRPDGGSDPDLSGDGYLIGGYAGYNYQMNNFVVGIEGDVSYGDVNPENRLWHPDVGPAFQDVDFFATIRARLGYAHGNTLAYVTGGAAWADSELRLPVQPDESDSQTHFGYVVGGGLEHAWTENFITRVEYLYADLGTESYNYPNSCSTAPDCNVNVNMADFHVVRAGAGWKF